MTFLKLICVFLASDAVWAKNSITANLNLTGDIAVLHHAVRKGGRCGNGSKDPYLEATRTYSAPLSLQTDESATATAALRADPHTSARFEVTMTASAKSDSNESRYRAQLNESQTQHGEYQWGHKCEYNHWNEYLKSAGYSGQITLRYEVPPDVWAVLVEQSSPNSVFSNAAEGRLSPALMDSVGNGRQIIWVKPGSILEKTFDVKVDANALRTETHFKFTIAPFAMKLEAADVDRLLDPSRMHDLTELMLHDGKKEVRQSSAEQFGVYTLSLLRSPGELRKGVKRLSLHKVSEFAQELFIVATESVDIDDSSVEATAKAAAALLSFEVASLMIEEMDPYCTERVVDDPITAERTSVFGATYARYLLENLLRHLDPKVLEAQRVFLDQFERIQSAGLSFAQVTDDRALSSSFQQAFRVSKIASGLSQHPFAQAHQDIADFFHIFRASSSDGSAQGILGDAALLAREEGNFRQSLRDFTRKFRHGNREKLDVSDLKNQIERMLKLSSHISEVLNGQGRFLSTTGDVEIHTLLHLLLEMKLKNVEIMASAYETQDFKFPFESIRREFVDQKRLKRNQSILSACISNGRRK